MFPRLPASLLPASVIRSALVLALAGLVVPGSVAAQDKPAKTASAHTPMKQASAKMTSVSSRKASAAKVAPAAPAPVAIDVSTADAQQLLAAKEVYIGESGCEFGQKIKVDANSAHPGYIDLSFNKKTYTMKPMQSPTGALRLEDVNREALMIQIASKTMVMNQKTGQRMVDNCVHPNQKTITADTTPTLIK